MEKFTETLLSGAAEYGLTLREGAAEAMELYARMLSERNEVMNLTAISGGEAYAQLHFLDSLALLRTEDFRGKHVIDVGTGAGFPGMALALAEPECGVTLLDSLGKRVDFLSEVSRATGVHCECIHARAEELAHDAQHREQYDFALSRAVAELNVLCELTLPYVRPGGALIAMKGPEWQNELGRAENAIATLGGEFERAVNYAIPGLDAVRALVIVRKRSPAPARYPRRWARISGKPL